ncbi:MAG: hypothetical protein LBS53_10870 [Synergistaceae bacterium]|nr:hypothetical protein [Synergistaceae bacterium]
MRFNALGFHFDDISGLRQVIQDESGGQKIAEFDILLENGGSIIGAEVKSKPSYDGVEDHVQRLKILRPNRDKKGDKRKIHGTRKRPCRRASEPPPSRRACTSSRRPGDTVKIDVPEGFIPQAW